MFSDLPKGVGRHSHPGLVHANCPSTDGGNPKNGKHEESVSRCGSMGKDTPEPLAGCSRSFAQHQARIYQEPRETPKQVAGAKWSKTHSAWHLPYTKEAFEKLMELFLDIKNSRRKSGIEHTH